MRPLPFLLPRRLSLGLVAILGCLPLSASGTIVKSVDSQGVIILGQSSVRSKAKTAQSYANPVDVKSENSIISSNHLSRFDSYVRQAAALYQLPEELVRAVIQVESGGNPRAVSPANAKGLMQLIPATAQRMQVEDIFDPRQNIFGGTRYLRVLANLFNGDLVLTVAAYNAGEGAVLRYGGIPPYRETEDYVTKVVTLYRKYRAEKR
jgi:soluble lytic murein transglycosylase-like protein